MLRRPGAYPWQKNTPVSFEVHGKRVEDREHHIPVVVVRSPANEDLVSFQRSATYHPFDALRD
jgi:hypothetical protein